MTKRHKIAGVATELCVYVATDAPVKFAKLRVTNRTQAAAAFLHGNDAVPVSSADIGVGAELIALQGR